MISNVVFLETTQSWPNSFTANNTKVELIARGLLEQGNNITIINSTKGEKGKKEITKGFKNGISYFDFPGKQNKLISRCLNIIRLFNLLRKCKRKNEKNIIIMGGPYYPFFLIIVLFCKIIGFKITITLSEWAVSIKMSSVIKKIDSFLYDFTFGYFVDGIFPISSFLEEKIKHFKKKSLKVPILADYQLNEQIIPSLENGYFLYCASTAYSQMIEMVIDSFHLFIKMGYSQNLKLILSGPDDQLQKIQRKITTENFSSRISIESQMPYDELIYNYRNALALLVPLGCTIQDKARFSQKIAEYISVSRPIITNSVGDVNMYFKDEETAFIADELSINEYSSLMEKVVVNLTLANRIGLNGRKLGEKEFNYKVYGEKIHVFLQNL